MNRSAASAEGRRRPVGVRRIVGLVAFVLTPLLSLGFGSWLAFVVAAVRYSHLGRRAAVLLWGSAVVQFVAAVGMVVTADAGPGTSGDLGHVDQ